MHTPVAVLGSTGSVGTQALDVVKAMWLSVDLLSAHSSVKEAEGQIRYFAPRTFVMTSEEAAKDLRTRIKDTSTRVISGEGSFEEAIGESKANTYIHAILGEAGLSPLLSLIRAGKRVGLANKESLVIAGDLIMKEAKEKGAEIIPVDSEHSAIFQCIGARPKNEIRSLLLTASGGPFYGYTREQLATVTKAQTLAHPTWKMGAKITVDSATLMNKGFEVIEAVRLFGVSPDQIKVVVHRESIIHSAVEYIDSAIIAQMGTPDMRLCVQYAFTYPHRAESVVRPLSLADIGRLTFGKADEEVFPLLSLAYSAIRAGGGLPAVLNAANEEVVSAFLAEKVSFGSISALVGQVVAQADGAIHAASLEDRLAFANAARRYAREIL
ncbi:MAG: 1-deoxy-D-xylulose-5-phosphate reductoisomerase [Clostridia bacterium]|nr:1-deoxy-D-xylulose-5-phosphate reductoisomerase [Clostridia bacterium]